MINLLKKHKTLAVATMVALVLFIAIVVVIAMLMVGGSSNKYGNRLEKIQEVKITGDEVDTIKSEIEDMGGVSSAKVNIEGATVKIIITYNSDIGISSAKEIAEDTLDNFSEEIKEVYNIHYILTKETEDEDEDVYVITGNKHPLVENIGWINGD